MYFLYKQAVYVHGVFWIGEDLEQGKKEANHAANRDKDDYHEWRLIKFVAPDRENGYSHDEGFRNMENCEIVYVGVRLDT